MYYAELYILSYESSTEGKLILSRRVQERYKKEVSLLFGSKLSVGVVREGTGVHLYGGKKA